mgnify:FL=1
MKTKIKALIASFLLSCGITTALADDVLIIDAQYSTVTANVKGRLEAAGHTVTVTTNTSTIPTGTGTYQQVWDLRYSAALTGGEQTAYQSFVTAGGFAYFVTENPGCCMARNNSVAALVTALGGGSTQIGPGWANNVETNMNTTYMTQGLTVNYLAVAAIVNSQGIPLISDAQNNVSGMSWIGRAGAMNSGVLGTIVTVADTNWLAQAWGTDNQQALDDIIRGVVAGTVAGTISASGNGAGATNGNSGGGTPPPPSTFDHTNTGENVATNTMTAGSFTGNGGTLTANSSSLTISNPIVLGANGMTYDANGENSTLSGVISGAGSITFTGNGITTLSATNTYTGSTTINSGATLVNNGSIATSSGVTNNGTFTNNGQAPGVTNAGTFTNGANGTAASLINTGTATNNGTITGTVTNNAGTFTNAGTTGDWYNAATVNNTGTMGNGTNVGTFTNGGAVGTVTNNTGGTFTNNGTTGAVANNATFVNNANKTTGAVANTGTFTNAGTTGAVTGNTGTFTNTGTTGAVTNSTGGTFTNSGTTGDWLNNGTLTNTGTMANGTNNGTMANSGTLGNVTNTGTLTVSGVSQIGDLVNSGTYNATGLTAGSSGRNYTQTGTGITIIDGNKQYSTNGTASLAGGIVVNNSPTAIGKYTYFTADSVTGQYDTLATSSPGNYRLAYTPTAVQLWLMPDNSVTQGQVDSLANNLNSMNSLASSSATGALGSDCAVFGEKGGCVSVSYGNTKVASGDLNSGGVTVVKSIDPNWRVGVYTNQQLNNPTLGNVTYKSNSPSFGGFVGWNENADGIGLGVQVSAISGKGEYTIGSDKTGVKSDAVQAKVSYSKPISLDTTVTPYVGLRHTTFKMDGYTEQGPVFPLTYGNVNQRATDLLAGVSVSKRLDDKFTGNVSAGVVQNLDNSAGSVNATSDMGNFSKALSGGRYTSSALSAGLTYEVAKDQKINATVGWQQRNLTNANIGSAGVSYVVGF